ncbi:MAG: LysM peptidoglycan-binding domain-containing protein [Acidimicrobiales bacterium]
MRAIKPPATHRRPRRRLDTLVALVVVAGVALAGPAATNRHTVRSGETLSEIAAANGVTVAALAKANGIADIHRVVAGTTLTIPAAAKASPPTHTVARGETLSEIAAYYGLTVRDLAEANGIVDVHRIRAGDVLALPGPASSTSGGAGVDVSRFPARLRSSPERLALVPVFERWADNYDVPLDLLMAMTWLESGWQNDVVSPVGAMGIGQLMPDTVTWLRDVIMRLPLDPHDPNDNIRMTTRYLKWLLDRTGGDAGTALAGYYQGLAAVRSSGVFPSTTVYVADVLAFRDRYF